MKQMQLSLSTEEWRQLCAWAAEEATGVQEIVERVLRRELDGRPRLSL